MRRVLYRVPLKAPSSVQDNRVLEPLNLAHSARTLEVSLCYQVETTASVNDEFQNT